MKGFKLPVKKWYLGMGCIDRYLIKPRSTLTNEQVEETQPFR
jgi:hypothetical protein